MGKMGYLFRLLGGESPESIVKGMPEDDYEALSSAIYGLKGTGLPRNVRRRAERKFRRIKR